MLQPLFKSDAERVEFERQRAHFAGCALTGLHKRIENAGWEPTRPVIDRITALAFSYADSMMQSSKQFEFVDVDE